MPNNTSNNQNTHHAMRPGPQTRSRTARQRRNAIPNLNSQEINRAQELRHRFRNLSMASPHSDAAGTYHHSGSDADADTDSDRTSDSDSDSPTSPWRSFHGNGTAGERPAEEDEEEEDAASSIERDFRTVLAISVAHAGGRHDTVHDILRASLQALTQEAVHRGVTAPSGAVPVPWTFVMHAASFNLVRFLLLPSNYPLPARVVYGQRPIPLRPPFVNWGLLAFTVSVSTDLVVGLPRLIASQYTLCPGMHGEFVELEY
ncbi:hypothetical protein ACRALDRAFT_1070998 [Sodiomyces alcalophilus JCM 7366]|uniref:uncharacterized protein n=1 Tax=Sodiomyces alcalophilus JCM 7366 TaxID=591952 RepID=UPI0039B628E8